MQVGLEIGGSGNNWAMHILYTVPMDQKEWQELAAESAKKVFVIMSQTKVRWAWRKADY
jgi:hypothetical protein